MAIYGIGAYWDGDDKTDEFVQHGKVCIGWWPSDAPSLYKILKTIKIGDIVYIKSNPPGELRIKAIGLVTDDTPFPYDEETKGKRVPGCIRISWLWKSEPVIIKVKDRYNVRANSLYEEYNSEVQKTILKLILAGFQGQRIGK